MKRTLFLLTISSALNSCMVFHRGSVSSGPLLSAGDQYVATASGHSKSLFVLGFGNIRNAELIQDAKEDLYTSHPLQRNEYYANMSADINHTLIFLVVSVIKVTVSAEVMKYNSPDTVVFSSAFAKSVTPLYSKKALLESQKIKIQNGDKLAEGDSVYYSYESGKYRLYSVLAPDNETVILKAPNSSYKTILVPIGANSFFFRNREMLGFKSGDIVLVPVRDEYNGETKDERANIYGICEQYALVKVSNGFKVYKLEALKKTN